MLLSADSTLFLKRGLKRGIVQLSRDRSWGMTLALLTALMVLVQLLLVFLLGVQGVNNVLSSRGAIQLEVLGSATDQSVQELYAALRNQPFVADVEYITREQAFERQKLADPELIAFIEEYNLENPFPDTFSVTLSALGDYDAFSTFVQQDRWRSVVNPSFLSSVTAQEREVRSLLSITGAVRTLTSLFLFISFLVVGFVIVEWAARTMSHRSDEVMLEHLLGAPPHAVVLPFAAEVMILLAASLIIGSALVLAAVTALPVILPGLLVEDAFRILRSEIMPLIMSLFPLLALLELLLLPALAFAGTVLGARKQLGWLV